MHKKRSKRLACREEKLQLSAMVDVVFLLLIFFVVTMKVDDVLASLPVSKPGHVTTPPVAPPPMLKIRVMPEGYYANQKRTTLKSLEKALTKISTYSTTQDIIIICSKKSEHSQLVRLLDTCSKAGLTNLHLFTQ